MPKEYRLKTAVPASGVEQAAVSTDSRIDAADEATIVAAIATILQEKGLTLSVAESCTGGLLAKMLTDRAGSSAWFLEGAVTYSNAAKIRQLSVPAALLDRHGAVSGETATAMATGMRTASGSDLALAVTGIAGPDGGTADKPVGTVFIALDDGGNCTAQRFLFHGDRENIRTVTAFTALDWLRHHLLAR